MSDPILRCAGCGCDCHADAEPRLYIPAGSREAIPYDLCRCCDDKVRGGMEDEKHSVLNAVELRIGHVGARMTDAELTALATRMARVFVGNKTLHYTADFDNQVIESSGKRIPVYRDVAGPPTVKEFEEHLKGHKGLLVIPVTAAGIARWERSTSTNTP